jgi:hypothetical protein
LIFLIFLLILIDLLIDSCCNDTSYNLLMPFIPEPNSAMVAGYSAMVAGYSAMVAGCGLLAAALLRRHQRTRWA